MEERFVCTDSEEAPCTVKKTMVLEPIRELTFRKSRVIPLNNISIRVEKGRRIWTYKHPEYGKYAVIENYPWLVFYRFYRDGDKPELEIRAKAFGKLIGAVEKKYFRQVPELLEALK